MQGGKNSRKSKQRNKCRKNNNRLKKFFKRKEKKKENSKNCEGPTQRQRYITTIKNVTEKKKSSKFQLDFIVPIKTTTTTEQEKIKKKIQKNLQNNLKHKNNKCFS